MSWHDLIDDASLERFVAGGDVASEVENGGTRGTGSNLYDTELVEAEDGITNNEEGITIVSSVPTATEYNNTLMAGYDTVLLDHPMDGSSLSLNPSSLDSSILTETSALTLLSEVVTEDSLVESPVETDRDSDSSVATYDNYAASSNNSTTASTSVVADGGGAGANSTARTATGRDVALEQAAKEMFLRSNTVEDWEREKENIMRIVYASESDCKDPNRPLADLFDEEETFFKNRGRDPSRHPQRGHAKAAAAAASPVALWDVALIGAVLSLAAAMLFRAVQRGR